jgi:hypothetical protein
MDDRTSFSTSPIPGATDAADLARWAGKDPLSVVLPLSILAAWAYSPPPVFHEVMRRRGVCSRPARLFEVVNDAMFVCAKAYIQPIGAGAVVAFRGTEPTNLINWLADATLQKVAFHAKPTSPPSAPHGYVHGGFYRNTRAIWPEVVEALDALTPEWIIFTGHSFGGALAVLAGALLADYAHDKPTGFGALWPKLRGIVTFGQPMVGDHDFAASYKASVGEKLVRFVYAHDIVPHLPPKTNGWTPVHFGTEYRAPDGASWTKEHKWSDAIVGALGANIVAVGAWMQDQMGLAPKLTLPYSWGDHAPNHYVRVSLPQGAESGSEFD